jgi:hypothetical protein
MNLENLEQQIKAEANTQAQAQEEQNRLVGLGNEIAEKIGYNPSAVSDGRLANLARAYELQADLATLRKIFGADRLARKGEIQLPKGRFANLSRGRGWCRRGDGTFFDDHIVGPGEYSVGSHDGFHRKERTFWKVEHIQVGSQVWTIANQK